MSREVPYDPLAICDMCGDIGAYDFQGDQLCNKCIREIDDDYSKKQIDNDSDDEARDD